MITRFSFLFFLHWVNGRSDHPWIKINTLPSGGPHIEETEIKNAKDTTRTWSRQVVENQDRGAGQQGGQQNQKASSASQPASQVLLPNGSRFGGLVLCYGYKPLCCAICRLSARRSSFRQGGRRRAQWKVFVPSRPQNWSGLSLPTVGPRWLQPIPRTSPGHAGWDFKMHTLQGKKRARQGMETRLSLGLVRGGAGGTGGQRGQGGLCLSIS